MRTPRELFLVSRTGDDHPCVLCYAFVRCALCVLLVCNVCWCVCWCWCWCGTLSSPPLPLLAPCVRSKRPSVCTFKTSPCVPAPRPQVLPHAGAVPAHRETFLNVHTGFSACHSTPHAHTATTTTYTTQHGNNTQHHGDRDRETDSRQRETEMKEERHMTREEKREKRREKREDEKEERR